MALACSRRARLLTALIAAGASFERQAPANAATLDPALAPVLTVGPVAMGAAQSAVERALGAKAADCEPSPLGKNGCYTDGRALLVVTFVKGRVASILMLQRGDARQHVARRVHQTFSHWRWNGAPVFADRVPSVPPGWTPVTGDAHGRVFDRAGYSVAKSFATGHGWLVTIGME